MENHPDEWGLPMPYMDNHSYVQGVDLANTRDYFVATVLDTTDPSLCHLVRLDRLQKKGYAYYKAQVRENWRHYGQPETLVDATTLAESVVQDLSDIGAQGYKFTGSAAKAEAVHELERMLNEHRLTLPNDPRILNELRYFQYKITPSKALKMEAREGHDDIVMSLALSSILASRPHNTGFFLPVTFQKFKESMAVAVSKRNSADGKFYDPWREVFQEGWE
jgi:hypothetical protein